MKNTGSCHCGQIEFEVDGVIDNGMACNCSICQRKGSLLWFTTPDNFRLKTPQNKVSNYTFNTHVIKHCFCSNCGIHPYGEGADPQGNRMIAINIRCIEGIDLDAMTIHHSDGRNI